MKFKQLPSRYFKEDGKFKIEYSVELDHWFYTFTTVEALWKEALGSVSVRLSDDRKTVYWVEECISLSTKATNYSDSELNFIFAEVIVDIHHKYIC